MRKRVFAAVLIGMFASVACSSSSGTGTASKQGGTLKVAVNTEPSNLDPAFQSSAVAGNLADEVVEELVSSYGGDGSPQPALATSWQGSPDAMTWSFTLRKGVKFQDGTAFDATAVKANFDRLLDPKVAALHLGDIGQIASTTVVDQYHVRFQLKKPIGYFAAVVSNTQAGILSPASFTTNGNTDQHIVYLVGTGPYSFVQYTKAVDMLVKRNDSYWGKKPAFSAIDFKIVPDAASREAMLRSGGADLVLTPPASDIPTLQKDPNFRIGADPSRYVIHFEINMTDSQQPLLQDVRVRQALNYAVDKRTIINKVLFGLADTLDSPFAKSSPGYCSAGAYSYDPNKARQLLQAANATNLTIKVESPTGRYLNDFVAAQAVVGYWQAVGIKVEGPTTADFASYVSGLNVPPSKANYQVALVGLGGAFPDPAGLVSYFVSTQVPPRGFNVSHYSDPSIDNIVSTSQVNPDRKAALPAYCQLQKTVWDAAPWVFLWSERPIVAYSAKITGVKTLPDELVDYNTVVPA